MHPSPGAQINSDSPRTTHIFSELSNANQSCWLRHFQAQRLNNFDDAGKAGAFVLRCLLALDLLGLDAEPVGQASLGRTKGDAGLD